MKLKVFGVWDAKAEAFLPPFFLPETAMAVRSFGDAVNDRGHAFSRNPQDYTLFGLGEYDCATGIFDAPAQTTLVNGVQVVRAVAPTAQRDFIREHGNEIA